jgi:hypothetical protein
MTQHQQPTTSTRDFLLAFLWVSFFCWVSCILLVLSLFLSYFSPSFSFALGLIGARACVHVLSKLMSCCFLLQACKRRKRKRIHQQLSSSPGPFPSQCCLPLSPLSSSLFSPSLLACLPNNKQPNKKNPAFTRPRRSPRNYFFMSLCPCPCLVSSPANERNERMNERTNEQTNKQTSKQANAGGKFFFVYFFHRPCAAKPSPFFIHGHIVLSLSLSLSLSRSLSLPLSTRTHFLTLATLICSLKHLLSRVFLFRDRRSWRR